MLDDIFNKYKLGKIQIWTKNERSKAIAIKNGFTKKQGKAKSLYELKLSDYENNKSKDIDEER